MKAPNVPHTAGRREQAGAWAARLLLLLLVLLGAGRDAAGQETPVRFAGASVRDAVEAIERVTPYRFLYRDALLTGKTVSFEAPAAALLPAFDRALRRVGLSLQVDEPRRLALITRAPASAPPPVLTGFVVDDRDGARLPYATVTWGEGGRRAGVGANEAGAFHVTVPAGRDTLTLTASYVGYRSTTLGVDLRRGPGELTIRLAPQDVHAQEVVVTGTLLQSDLDTTWHPLLHRGLRSTFGEGGVLRSLQVLPSVAFTGALSPGLVVRGSRSDGFQVLLDGIAIYSQSHLFGLFDAFNEEALQTVGFYYGITPARYQGPPGGTLSFVTRTGSQTQHRFTGGLSNTAVRGTAEGPLFGGRGSWLVSARHSYLNAVDWFGNSRLVAQGLDVNRPSSLRALLADRREGPVPGPIDARFYDLHAKLYREADDGHRMTMNLYAGRDDTGQSAERYLQGTGGGMGRPEPELRTVETRNSWGNTAFSLQDQRAAGTSGQTQTVLGFSHYYSRYRKDDFTYTFMRPGQPGEPEQPGQEQGQVAIAPFTNSSTLSEWKFAQQLERLAPRGASWNAGYSLHRFDLTYGEASMLRVPYARRWSTYQLDAFGEYDTDPARLLVLNLGLRTHYFSEGSFLRFSPRLQARLAPAARVSAGLGLSRNHQFLHRLSLPYSTTTDVWVLSTEGQPPAAVDNVTGGVYARLGPSLFVQAEVYHKTYRNLRQHETVLLPRRSRQGSLLLDPWLHDNTAKARGLEVMARQQVGPVRWTNSYALTRVTLRNPALYGGAPFRADWDRTHQLTSALEVPVTRAFTLHLTWLFASGAPNALAASDPAEPASLPAYHRLDASLVFRRTLAAVALEATASVFNLYDRQNTWYRSAALVPDPNGAAPMPRRLTSVSTDVYDLGFQPSFSLTARF